MNRLLILTSIICIVCSVCGFNFNINNVIQISIPNDSYFGYSLLLKNRSIIVGAPRQNSNYTGGSVYSCSLDGECQKLKIIASSRNSFNGNFLGMSIDGDENNSGPLIVCAPRIVRPISDNNYLNGYCFYNRNSTSNIPFVEIKPLENESPIDRNVYTNTFYYNNAFGQVGFDVQYLKTGKVVLGAPGLKTWNGGFVIQSLSNLQSYKIVAKKTAPIPSDYDEYLGYKVTTAKFESTRRKIWFIAGAPRGNVLLGVVKIFDSSEKLVTTLSSNELGCYFGASILAEDLNNDRIDDLLVGAPMGAGSTWDEGYVFFYKRDGSNFQKPIKLIGGRKIGARFGTSITTLGDIDLDGYKDVAISAPYENNGEGAVYIYRGSINGINLLYSQRLSPLQFSHNIGTIKGFGLGLSRGLDIDNNGHNDLAIGAFKSGQVFIIKTISVIDFKLSLEFNVSSITSDTLNIKYCIYYTQRSSKQDLTTVQFKTQLLLDYRTRGETNITEIVNVALSKEYCISKNISITQSIRDIVPFKVSFSSQIERADIIGKGENNIEKSIPYSHGCGADNICQTQILLEVFTPTPNIVLGLTKEFIATITAENVGEPGYECNLYMNFPEELELRNYADCNFENGTYICPFTTRLFKKKEAQIKFDIKTSNPKLNQIIINFDLKCLGVNSPPNASISSLPLEVILQNDPRIQGSSDPNNIYFDDENIEDKEMSHVFKITNFGPSPVKLDVSILLPTIKKDETSIFEIVEAKGSLNGIQVECFPTNTNAKYERTYDLESILSEPLNKTIVIDCFMEGVECIEIFCDGEYITKLTEIAKYTIKIKTRTKLLASFYHDELLKKDIMAYVSTAFLFNSENGRVENQSSTLILSSSKKSVPIWIYIAGAIIGIILLALLILLMYKCHFFDRNFRDKLNDEKLMDQQMDNDADGE